MISVITPSCNSSLYIRGSIESVLRQSFVDWEMIVVDDCSTDDSASIVRFYSQQDSRIKLLQLSQNSGAAVARNKAIEVAQGRYIAFLDSDDRWLPGKLEKQIRFMQENDYAFSYSAYEKLDEYGKAVGVVSVPEKVRYKDLLKVCHIGCLTAMYDTEKLGKIYMPLIRKRQDLGLWLRILKRTSYAYGIPEVLAQYQLRSDSISANKLAAALYTWRLYREFERLNVLQAGYYFSHYAVNGILRSRFPSLAKALGKL